MIIIDDLTISLLALIGLRFFACIVFVELFLRQRKSKYAVLALAWLAYMASPVWGLVGRSTSGDVDHPLFGYFAAVGTLLLVGGVFLYYQAMSRTKLIIGISLITAVLGIAVLLYPETSGVFAILAQLTFITITLLVFFFRRKWFLAFGGNSYYWLFPIILLSLFHAFGFRFIYPETPFSVRLFLTFLVNVSLLIFFLHFEYNQSLMRLNESEERYRFLFDAAPVALWEEDATEITADLAELRLQGIRDMRQYFNTHPEFLPEILEKLNVLSVNQAAVLLFQASSKQELTSGVERVFRPEPYQAFAEAVACLFEDTRQTTIETVLQTLEGETRDVIIDIHFPNPDTPKNATIVSMVDISGRKRVEEELKKHHERLEELVAERAAELQTSEAQLKAQFKSAPVPTYIWQKVEGNLVLVDYNDAAEEITQDQIANFVGVTLDEMYQDAPEIQKDIGRALAEKTTIEREMRYQFRSTGESRHLAVKYAYAPPDLVLVHTDDVTERVQAEELIRTQWDLGMALNAASSLSETLRLCLKAALNVSGMDCGGVYLIDENSGDIDLVVHAELPSGFLKSASHYSADSANARLVAKGEPIYTRYQELDVSPDETRRREGLRAIAVIPVRHEDQVIACLNVASHTLDEVPDYARIVLETIVTQIGNAIIHTRTEEDLRSHRERLETLVNERAAALKATNEQLRQEITERKQAEEEIRRRNEELTALNAIAMAVTSTLDLQEVLRTIQEHVVTLLGEKYPPVFGLFHEADQAFEIVATGRQKEMLEKVGKSLGLKLEGLAFPVSTMSPALRQSLFAGKPYVTNNASDFLGSSVGRGLVQATHRALGVKCIVDAPFFLKGKFVGGMILLSQREEMSGEEIELLASIASQAAIAIENARLYEEVRQELAERKQAEGALERSWSFFQAVTEQSGEGISVAGVEANYVLVNAAFCEMTGYSGTELLSMNVRDLIHAEIDLKLFSQVTTTKQRGGTYTTQLQRKDGSHFYAEISGSPIELENERLVLGIVRDITERVQAEESLQKLNAELDERIRDRTAKLQKFVNLMAGREVRMAGLKDAIRKLRAQLEEAELTPVADDPLLAGREE